MNALHRFARFVIVGCVALVLLAGPRVTHASGTNYCLTSSAQATLLLGPGLTSVQASSGNAAYATSACGSFIVDVKVPSNSGASHYESSFRIYDGMANGLPTTKAVCQSVIQYESIYRKQPQATGFTFIGGGKLTGTWVPASGGPFTIPAHCELTPASTYHHFTNYFSPPSTGTAIYRVTVAAESGTRQLVARPVQVMAVHPPIIY